MTRFLVLVVALLSLTGCPSRGATKPEPFPAQCDARCFAECDDAVPAWTPPDPDAPDAFDYIPEQVVAPLQAKVRTCDDVHRNACVQCLKRLEAVNVIKL